jgi:predicted site-specific integrase-resolvase
MKPSLLNPEQAAKVLQMDRRTLIAWARLGYVPAHPLGEGKRKLWRFLEHELLDWVEAQESSKKRPPASTMKVAISAHARRTAA